MQLPILYGVAGGTAAALIAILAFFVRRMVASESVPLPETREFSLDYYRPMGRLLNREEQEALAVLGGSKRQIQQLRQSRRRVFRCYLADLQADFSRLHLEARILFRDSATDRPDLAAELVRQYLRFHSQIAMIQLELAAHAMGLDPVNVAPVLAPLAWLDDEMTRVRSAAAA
jgi:hypothetical protein